MCDGDCFCVFIHSCVTTSVIGKVNTFKSLPRYSNSGTQILDQTHLPCHLLFKCTQLSTKTVVIVTPSSLPSYTPSIHSTTHTACNHPISTHTGMILLCSQRNEWSVVSHLSNHYDCFPIPIHSRCVFPSFAQDNGICV